MTYLGEIRLLPQSRIPSGWLPCDGQLLETSKYNELFTLLGNLYGGDFFSFGLPDLRGRVAMGVDGHFPGHSGGEATHDLTLGQMPMHSHTVQAGTLSDKDTPKGNYPGMGTIPAEPGLMYPLYCTAPDGLAGAALVPTGGFVPHQNMMPSLVMVYCICVAEGVVPSAS